jgi:hypothetical protein
MYETPTPHELKKFMGEHNLTGADIAALAGVTPRAARRWVEPANQKGSRPIPWAAWIMILLLTGKATVKDIKENVNQWKKEKIGRGLFERGTAGRPPKEEKDEKRN